MRPEPGPGIVERIALLDRLHDTLATHAAIWVASPAGSGKTTLIGDFLEHRDYRHVWYQLDPDDSDPAMLFEYLGMAASAFSRADDPPLPHLTPEYTLGVSTFARRFFESFYALFRDERFVVVLDNYQRLDSRSVVHELLAEALQSLPANGHAIIASRASAPAAYARLQVNNSLASFDWEDMRFSREECQAFLAAHGIDDDPADALLERTRGWVAGMRLMVTDRTGRDRERVMTAPSEHQLLFNYFAAEIFGTRTPPDREFLLRTSLLPSMTIDMAARLTERAPADVEAILGELHGNNYFIERLTDREPLYRYHPLFREFLLARSEKSIEPQRLRRLKRSAAALLSEDGQIEEAASLLIDVEDWVNLTRLCVDRAPRLLAAGRNQTLSSWIDRIPEERRLRSPWLCYWRAVSLSIFDHHRAREMFRDIYDAFRRADDVTGQYLVCASAMETYFLAWDEYVSCAEWLERLNDLRARHPCYPSVEIEAKVNSGILACLQWSDGGHERFPGMVRRCRELVRTLEDPNQCIFLGSLLLWFEQYYGDMHEGELVVGAVAAKLEDKRVSPATLIHWHCAYATHVLNFAGNAQAALAASARAEQVAAASGIHVFDGTILATATHLQLAMGKDEMAARTLSRLAGVLKPGRIIDHAYYSYLLGLQALVRRDIADAEKSMRLAMTLARKAGALTAESLVHLQLVFISLSMKDPPRARDAVTELQRIARQTNSNLVRSNALLANAMVTMAGDSPAEQRQAIAAMLAFLREKRYLNYWGRSAGVHAGIYARALQLGIETPFVTNLIRTKKIEPDDSAVLPDAWPFPVKLYALGRFAVRLDDAPLQFSGKAQKKPLELLKGLIAYGGREVDEAKLAGTLWPLAEDAPQALATTVHRLRRLIGEEAIERREGHLTLNPRHCWLDVWALERRLDELDDACTAKDTSRVISLAEQALGLYGDAFPPADGEPSWMTLARERWRHSMRRRLEPAAGLLAEGHQHDAAIRLYRKALDIDPMAEALYVGLMQSCLAAGRSIEALSTYERCRQILGANIEAVASFGMEALAYRLR